MAARGAQTCRRRWWQFDAVTVWGSHARKQVRSCSWAAAWTGRCNGIVTSNVGKLLLLDARPTKQPSQSTYCSILKTKNVKSVPTSKKTMADHWLCSMRFSQAEPLQLDHLFLHLSIYFGCLSSENNLPLKVEWDVITILWPLFLALIFTPQTTKKTFTCIYDEAFPWCSELWTERKTRTGMWDDHLALSKFLSKDAEVLCENSFP